jgi:hypothetical protein
MEHYGMTAFSTRQKQSDSRRLGDAHLETSLDIAATGWNQLPSNSQMLKPQELQASKETEEPLLHTIREVADRLTVDNVQKRAAYRGRIRKVRGRGWMPLED